jgi:exonuclease SbcD
LRGEAEQLDPDLPAIVVGHAHLFGARIGAERLLTMGADPMYDLQTFDLPSVDYIALGHIHKHQQVGPAAPPAVYSGSLERIDFGEEREQKGFVVVEIGPGPRGERRTTWTFHPVAARPFVTLRLAAGGEDPLADVRAAVEARRDVAGAIVRAFITLTPEAAGQLRLGDVRRLLLEAGAAFVGQIVPEVERVTRVRLPLSAGEELDPLQMLRHWLETQHTPPDRAEVLLRYADELIKETS